MTGSPRWHTTKIEKMRDTSHDLWGRGEFHTGFNMLGKLEMVIRDDIRSGKLKLENQIQHNPRDCYRDRCH